MVTAAKAYPPIVIGFFARGLNTNRQPLFSALTGVGLQVIQFKDYLIDGINIECSDRFTLQRAPGFTKFCSAQLAATEKVNQFYSTRDLNGNVYPLVDTNQNLYKMTPSSLTSLLTKGTTNQGFIQQIGGVTYYANGTDLKKWIPPASGMAPWGVASPGTIFFSVAGDPGGSIPGWAANATFGYQDSLLDSNGNIEYQTVNASVGTNVKAIPLWNTVLGGTVTDGNAIWQNVGPTGNWVASYAYTAPTVVTDTNNFLQLVTVAGTSGATVPSWNTTIGGTTTDGGVTWTNIGPGVIIAYSGYGYVACYRTVSGNLSTGSASVSSGPLKASIPVMPITITGWSITSNVATLTASNALIAGTTVQLSGFTGAGSIFNNFSGSVLSSGLSSSQFEINFTNANASGSDAGIASLVFAIVEGPSSSNPECTASATITAVHVASGIATITASNNFTPGITILCSGVGAATFLNGVQLQVTSATSLQFTVSLPNQADYGPASDTGTATFLAIEIYRTQDGGGVYYFDGATANGGSPWTFFDATADGSLTTELVAPLAHLNDPPPGAVGSTVTSGGTILAWWSNRLWMAVGNLLYFSGGPDILNGIPEECWPPANVFVFPGTISSLKATTGGLVVVIPEEVWAILGGPQTVAYYPDKILSKLGALSANCVIQDGDNVYLHSSQKRLVMISGSAPSELGSGGSGVCPVGDILANGSSSSIVTASAWSATASYLTIHRQGEDSGIYLSNGVESIIRYGLNVGNFSPIRKPMVTGAASAGALNSIETSPGQYSLLMNPNVAHDYIYARDTSAFTDNGHAYASSAVVGNIVVTEVGTVSIESIAAYLYNRGSLPAISFIPNDISPASSAFTLLPTALPDPALLPAPVNLISKRWPLMMNQAATPIALRHLQIKVDFGNTGTVKNELIQLSLVPAQAA